MSFLTDMTDRRVGKVLTTLKSFCTSVSGIGLVAEGTGLKPNAASWKISFKFVLNTVSCVIESAKNAQTFPDVTSGLNLAISIPKTSKTGSGGRFGFGQLQRAKPATPKFFFVNPMITESA